MTIESNRPLSSASNTETCFACEKSLAGIVKPYQATTSDGQLVYVGRDCFSKIRMWGKAGYSPPKGGPKLWTVEHRRPTYTQALVV